MPLDGKNDRISLTDEAFFVTIPSVDAPVAQLDRAFAS